MWRLLATVTEGILAHSNPAEEAARCWAATRSEPQPPAAAGGTVPGFMLRLGSLPVVAPLRGVMQILTRCHPCSSRHARRPPPHSGGILNLTT